ncbi:MAG: hypothetical protein IJ132_05770 [Firmicutes bacterium]|nr:hypothetical protein [Bacillota bacterium]
MEGNQGNLGYGNAKRGITLIYMGQLLSIAAAIMMMISVGMIAVKGEAPTVEDVSSTSMILMVVGLLCALAAFLMKFFGVTKASSDDGNFKKALTFLIIGLVASIIQSAVDGRIDWLSDLGAIAKGICDLAVTVFIIRGVATIAENIGNDPVRELGNRTLKMIVLIYLLVIAMGVIMLLLNGDSMATVEGILAIGAMVISVIAYIMFLKLLSQGRKML